LLRDCLPADVHVLASLPWCSVVVDRRQRSRSAAGKAQLALQVRHTGCAAYSLHHVGAWMQLLWSFSCGFSVDFSQLT
jgi:hypothetical protein